MEDLALGNNPYKFINALLEDEGSLAPNNETPSYAGIKGLLTSLGLDIDTININIEGTQKIGDVLKTVTSSSFLIGALAPIINELINRDSYFRECCSAAKKTDRIRIQLSDFNFASKPQINTNNSRISYIQNFIVERITSFFASLSNKMLAMKNEKQKSQSNDNVVGKTNIAQNIISYLGEMGINTLKTSLDGGFTTLGVSVVSGINLSAMKKPSMSEEPAKLELENSNLQNLKNMREEAMRLALEQNPALLEQEGYSMKMIPNTQKGFTSISSLLIFLSILVTITEFALIVLSVYN